MSLHNVVTGDDLIAASTAVGAEGAPRVLVGLLPNVGLGNQAQPLHAAARMVHRSHI